MAGAAQAKQRRLRTSIHQHWGPAGAVGQEVQSGRKRWGSAADGQVSLLAACAPCSLAASPYHHIVAPQVSRRLRVVGADARSSRVEPPHPCLHCKGGIAATHLRVGMTPCCLHLPWAQGPCWPEGVKEQAWACRERPLAFSPSPSCGTCNARSLWLPLGMCGHRAPPAGLCEG